MSFHPKHHPLPTAQQSAELTAAEAKYCLTAFDLAAAPLGSRDWTIYWRGWHDRSRASLGAAQVPAYEEARDAILNERGPLEGMGLTGDQINAVLAILDDSFQTIQGGQ